MRKPSVSKSSKTASRPRNRGRHPAAAANPAGAAAGQDFQARGFRLQGFRVPRGRFLETSALTGVLALAGCLAVGALVLGGASALANPLNGTVVDGSVSIGGQPGELVVRQSTDKAIIDWQSFNIGVGELTRFVQPGANSITLNRVTGGMRSDIAGSLQANGNIWLVNPNGVLIKSGARVDVGGLLATTADIRNQDFMAGAYSFDRASANPNATVVNEGTITLADRGIAALVAPHVRNSGLIEGRLSQVVLAGAPTFLVDFQGDGLMRFEATGVVEKAPEGVQELVRNNGVVRAPGGRVTMTARAASGILDKVINMDGVVEAQSVQTVNGSIVLSGEDSGTVAVSGRLDVQGTDPGTVGGTVQVSGQKVAVESGARINAQGRRGGGTVQIGGGVQGKGLRFTAKQTKVAAGARIDASATEHGDGGQIVVWSDNSTEFSGAIVARGAGTGGNGGFAEVSGKSVLNFRGSVDLAAAGQGRGGTLLLDPTDITIGNADANVTGAPSYQPDGTNPAAATIDAATLGGFLNAGTNVTVVTTSAGGGTGNILVAAPITMNGVGNTATLSLQADGGITVQNTGSIASTAGTLNVTMNANGSGVSIDGAISITGNLSVTAAGSILQSAALTVGGTSSFTAGANAITLSNAGNALTGAVTLSNSGTNDASLTNTLATSLSGTVGQDLTVSSGGTLGFGVTTVGRTLTATATDAVTQTGAITANSLTVKTLKNGGAAITLGNAGNDVTTLDLRSRNAADTADAAGALSYTDATALDLAVLSTTSTVSITSGGALTQSGALTVGGTSSFTAGANAITLSNAGNALTGAVTLSNSGTNDVSLTNTLATALSGTVGQDLTVSSGGTLGFGATTVGRTLTATATDAVTQTGAITANSLTVKTLKNGGAAITLGNAGNDVTTLDLRSRNAADTADAAGALSYTDATALDLAALSTTSTVSITSGGALTQSGVLTVGGTSSFTAGANAITLGNAGNALTGAVTLSNSGTNDVSLTNTLATSFSGTVGRNLTVSSGGALTQSGGLTVGGTSSFTAGANAITLSNTGNALTGAVTLSNSGTNDVSLTNTLATSLSGTVGQDLTVSSGGTLGFGATSVGRTLTATASDAVTQTGAITANSLTVKMILPRLGGHLS